MPLLNSSLGLLARSQFDGAAGRGCPKVRREERPEIYDGMFWGMGWMHLVGVVLVALVIAALVKYLFFR